MDDDMVGNMTLAAWRVLPRYLGWQGLNLRRKDQGNKGLPSCSDPPNH